MKDLGDLHVFATDEMVDRAFDKISEQIQPINTGSERLDESVQILTRRAFRAGWLGALQAIVESELRKDGIGG